MDASNRTFEADCRICGSAFPTEIAVDIDVDSGKWICPECATELAEVLECL